MHKLTDIFVGQKNWDVNRNPSINQLMIKRVVSGLKLLINSNKLLFRHLSIDTVYFIMGLEMEVTHLIYLHSYGRERNFNGFYLSNGRNF